MASKLRIDFSAELGLTIDSTTCSAPSGDSGCHYDPDLRDKNKSADLDAGAKIAQVDSPAAFVALPWPAGLQARAVYLKPHDSSSTYTLRVSYAGSGDVDIPCGGLCLSEAPTDDLITAVAIQGALSFEWAAWGGLA